MVYSSRTNRRKGRGGFVELGLYLWLIVAAVAAVVEVLSLSLITLWFVVGALAAFVAALLGANIFVQTVVFLVVSVACLILLRPVIMKYRMKGAREEPSLIGQSVVVCEDIDNDRMVGRVQTSDRMTWAARSADGRPIPQGENAVVVDQESIKLIVERKLA